MTFEKIALEWVHDRAVNGYWNQNSKGEKETAQILKKHVFSTLGKMDIETITPEDILIRSTRRKLGLSQEEFAERIGAPLATLRGWEQGRFQPSGVVIRLMQLLSKYPELIHDTDSETQTAIQLDKDVLIALRRVMGNGWQTQVNDVMREWVKQQSGR